MDRLSHLPEAARSRIRTVIDRLPGRSPRRGPSRPKPRAPFQRLLNDVFARDLAGTAQPVILLVTDHETEDVVQWLMTARPDARLHRVSALERDEDLHVAAAAHAPYDLVIDDSSAKERMGRVRRYVYLVRPGGVVLVRRLRAKSTSQQQRDQFARLMTDIGGELIRPKKTNKRRVGDAAHFGRAVRGIAVRDNHLLLVGDVRAQAKIREEQVATLLRARPDLGHVVAEVPGGELTFRGDLRMSAVDHQVPNDTTWTAPTVMLRQYNGVLTSPGQIVTAGSLVLPETYRHFPAPRLTNQWVADLAPDFADATEPAWFARCSEDGTVRTLPGAYFYLDSELRGHFGHMTTEVVSRLWAWQQAKAADPSLKAIMHFNKHRDLSSWEVTLLEAAGIPADDIEFSYEPVRVEHLLAATPMFVNPTFAHPGIAGVWRGIGDNLAAQSSASKTPKRIFIGRRIAKRPCRNADEVEAFFTALGFTVVYPEDSPLPDQVRMFRDAEIIAGFAGSGMFNLMFTPEPKPVILVSSESYWARNEFLIAGVLGHDLAIAWSRSEATWNGERFGPGALQAGFSFDPEREGAFIRDVVAGSVGR